MVLPTGVLGEVDGSVISKCKPRNTAAGISESMKYGTPVIWNVRALSPKSTAAAVPATSVISKKYVLTP